MPIVQKMELIYQKSKKSLKDYNLTTQTPMVIILVNV